MTPERISSAQGDLIERGFMNLLFWEIKAYSKYVDFLAKSPVFTIFFSS
jgi:hypothetical protein